MRQKLLRAIGTLGLVFVLFFSTSGGPYTTETLIHSVGPGLGLLILALVPLIWSTPEALIVGELASMLPEEGGYYRWVDRAFGRFWAFQNGWLTWVYSLVDMAIYPVLFNQYALFRPRTRRASGMAHLACHYLGCSMDQHPRLSERHSHFNYRRVFHHARLSCFVS